MSLFKKVGTAVMVFTLLCGSALAGSAFQSTLQSNQYYYFSSDGTGQVGFGTTAPAGLLDVRGSLCLNGGADCRTTWPSTDTNIWTKNVNDAYYTEGLVGIGVTDPDTTLEVYKVGTQLKLSGGAADYATFATAADGALTITTVDADAALGDIILMPDGNVGIGTTETIRELTVKGDISIYTDINGAASLFFSRETSGAPSYVGSVWYNHASNNMGFNVNGDTRLQINDSGNVGIGTTAPGNLLHLYVDVPVLNMESSHAYGESWTMRSTYGPSANTGVLDFRDEGGQAWISMSNDAGSPKITLNPNGVTGVLINSTGNVGIGTTDIESWSTSYKAIEWGGNVNIMGYATNDADVLVLNDNAYYGSGWKRKYSSPAMNLKLQTGALVVRTAATGVADSDISWTDSFTILNSGNVGIGTTAPDTTLHIDGDTGVAGTGLKIEGTNPTLKFYDTDGSANENYQLRVVDGDLAFQTQNDVFGSASTKVTIQNSGNVGIGTVTPGAKLHIEGGSNPLTMLSNSDAGGNFISTLAGTTNVGFIYDDSGDFIIRKQNVSNKGTTSSMTSVMTIDSSGNVGIGTTAPGAKLTVYGPYGAPSYANASTYLTNQGSAGLYMGMSAGVSPYPFWLQTSATGSDATQYPLSLNPLGGNVGIGTTAPDTLLSVFSPAATGSGVTNILHLDTKGNAGDDGAAITFTNNLGGQKAAKIYTLLTGNDKANLVFARGDGADGYTETMMLDSNGNVGIGTTATRSYAKVDIITSSNTGLFVGYDAGGGIMMGYSGATIQGRSGSGLTVSDNLMINPYGGNVGIGTTAPSQKLEVNGSVLATAYYYSSDRTLKKDVSILDNALAKIKQLEGVSFKWKDAEKGEDTNLGLIAQDVEKVYPELVSTDEGTGLKSVQYGNLVAPIIEAIKESAAQVADLFAKYVDQQAQIDNLESRIEELEKVNNQ